MEKTKEEIIKKYIWIDNTGNPKIAVLDAISAMEEYADQYRSLPKEQEQLTERQIIDRIWRTAYLEFPDRHIALLVEYAESKIKEERTKWMDEAAKVGKQVAELVSINESQAQEIERLKSDVDKREAQNKLLLVRDEKREKQFQFEIKENGSLYARIESLEAQLKEAKGALSLAIKRVQWFAYNTSPKSEVYCGAQWFTKLSNTKDLFKALESSPVEQPEQKEEQPEDIRKNCYIGTKIGCHCTTECHYRKMMDDITEHLSKPL